MLLEADLGLVQCPTHTLEIRADVEEVRSVWMEYGEDSLLTDRDAKVWV